MSVGRKIRSRKDNKGDGSHFEGKRLIENTREEGTQVLRHTVGGKGVAAEAAR